MPLKLMTGVQVLIGCDGVNSVVAKWLGLTKPSSSGRLATRGLAHYPDGHGLDPRFKMFVGHGFRAGVIPCNETDAYWFFTWSPSEHGQSRHYQVSTMSTMVI
jgi:2-polyprenyl-6-methoxyphenol hydroxylase-like FAD-dependent oxidoreductase